MDEFFFKLEERIWSSQMYSESNLDFFIALQHVYLKI